MCIFHIQWAVELKTKTSRRMRIDQVHTIQITGPFISHVDLCRLFISFVCFFPAKSKFILDFSLSSVLMITAFYIRLACFFFSSSLLLSWKLETVWLYGTNEDSRGGIITIKPHDHFLMQTKMFQQVSHLFSYHSRLLNVQCMCAVSS